MHVHEMRQQAVHRLSSLDWLLSVVAPQRDGGVGRDRSPCEPGFRMSTYWKFRCCEGKDRSTGFFCAPVFEDLRPGRSRDYSLELPQIRTCTLNASGSSRCGIAVPHTTGWFRGDTLMRHDVLGVVPTPRPQRGTPFAPRVREAVPPLQHYYGALRLLAVHLAALRFLRLAIPSVCPLFVPTSSGQESCGSTWSW